MPEQPASITRLEWITCPECSQTFQVAVPTRARDILVRQSSLGYKSPSTYHFRVRCINPSCRRSIFVEIIMTDV